MGSNGKGTTASFLAALANPEKQKTGLFTSPHLLSVLERICIGTAGLYPFEPICAQTAWEGLCEIKKIFPKDYKGLSYFEILTVLALYLFRKNKCGLQIYEAGLGGRLDATRAAQAQNAVLTCIEKEHISILGKEPNSILEEKLGIIGQQTKRLFCMPQKLLSKRTIEDLVKKAAPHVEITFYEKRKKQQPDNYLEENKEFAAFILRELNISCKIDSAVKIQGRLEKKTVFVSAEEETNKGKENREKKMGKEIIFDTAHNPAAMLRSLQDLSQNASEKYRQKSLIFLALLQDRSVKPCLRAVHQAGFFQICQLIGEGWASPEGALPQIQQSAAAEQLANKLRSTHTDRIIFLGTHRTYCFFNELQKADI